MSESIKAGDYIQVTWNTTGDHPFTQEEVMGNQVTKHWVFKMEGRSPGIIIDTDNGDGGAWTIGGQRTNPEHYKKYGWWVYKNDGHIFEKLCPTVEKIKGLL